MPANLSPEYKTAEAAYKRAREPRERLEALREMLRAIPKHKGTDHLQADIKTRIKELTDEVGGPKKTGVRTGPQTVFKPEGAGQIALLGPPTTGKSTLHARLTGSHSPEGPYPFTTQFPQPGMLPVEDIHIQLIDLPSVSPEHPIPWLANAAQPADGALFVIDLSRAGCLERTVKATEVLAERRIRLHGVWPEGVAREVADEDDPFGIRIPTLLVANKADLIDDVDGEMEVFRDLTGLHFPYLAVSAATGEGIDELARHLFQGLGVVRVYTKVPHKPPDMGRPYTVRHGQTVGDVALLVHKEVAAGFKYARLWGGGDFDGQQVGRDHLVEDGDVLEMHA